MTLSVAHQFGACSTVILYDFPGNYDRKGYIKYFYSFFDKKIEHLGSSVDFDEYAFLLVSCYTNPYYYKIIHDFMKEVGFQSTEPTYNKKNDTTIQLWTIPVPLLIKNITKLYNKLTIADIEGVK